MLKTSHNDNLIMFSENITVILKFTIDFDRSVPLVLNGKFLPECSFILVKHSVETSGFTMS